ncbi:hypothetical protein PFL02_60680 [Pseudomonas fluorescens]|nr:hypothetical protein PFL02_60680 [Pseudomonas fluorescens]
MAKCPDRETGAFFCPLALSGAPRLQVQEHRSWLASASVCEERGVQGSSPAGRILRVGGGRGEGRNKYDLC